MNGDASQFELPLAEEHEVENEKGAAQEEPLPNSGRTTGSIGAARLLEGLSGGDSIRGFPSGQGALSRN